MLMMAIEMMINHTNLIRVTQSWRSASQKVPAVRRPPVNLVTASLTRYDDNDDVGDDDDYENHDGGDDNDGNDNDNDNDNDDFNPDDYDNDSNDHDNGDLTPHLNMKPKQVPSF